MFRMRLPDSAPRGETPLLISYRTFRNGDPPSLARIWNLQPPSAQRINKMTALILDDHVCAKSYFDPLGLLVAEEDSRAVGFAHAGFGPAADGARLEKGCGATLILMVESRPDQDVIAAELLRRAEVYLKEAGARTLVGGLPHPLEPFYFGLSGGSGAAGVLACDAPFSRALAAAGYAPAAQQIIYRRDLANFRPSFERLQMQWRRSATATMVADEAVADWWEAQTLASTERLRTVVKLKSPVPRATLSFWDLRPLTDSWGERAQALLSFACDDAAWTDGLAQFVWSESLEQLRQRGANAVEATADSHDVRLVVLLAALGFKESARSVVWTKPVEDATA